MLKMDIQTLNYLRNILVSLNPIGKFLHALKQLFINYFM